MKSEIVKTQKNKRPSFKQGELVELITDISNLVKEIPNQVVLVTGPGYHDLQFSGVVLFEFFDKNSDAYNRLGNHSKLWSKRRFKLFKDTLEISN